MVAKLGVELALERPRRSTRRHQVIAILPRLENQSDRFGQPQPAGRLFLQLLSPFGREAIELRLAAGVRHLPVRGQQPAVFEPVQRRIERALRHLDYVARDQLKALRDGVAVNGPGGDDLEDQQVERALGEIGFVGQPYTSVFYLYRTTCRSARCADGLLKQCASRQD